MKNLQQYIDSLASINLFDGHGVLSANCKLYATKNEAEAACLANGGAIDATWRRAFDAAKAAAKANIPEYNRVWRETWHAAYDEISDQSSDAAYAAALLAVCLLVQDYIDESILDYVRSRWAVFTAGCGAYGDSKGTLYCYRRP